MNADELKKDVIAAMNAAVCGALDTGSLIDIEKTAQSIADKYAQLSAQSAVQPVAVVNSWVNGSYHRKYDISWLQDVEAGTELYTRADADAIYKARYEFIKTMPKEMLLFWRGAYGCDDVALDAAMAQSTEGAKQ